MGLIEKMAAAIGDAEFGPSLVELIARHRALAFAAGRAAREREIVEWLRELSGHPASALEGQPPRGEVWVLHRAADAIERGEV